LILSESPSLNKSYMNKRLRTATRRGYDDYEVYTHVM